MLTLNGSRPRAAALRWLQDVFVALARFTMGLTGTLPAIAQAPPLRVLATGVFATTLLSLAPPFETATGQKVQVTIANAGQVAARLAAGWEIEG